MFTESAELYDLIYSTIRNYSAEAEQIAALLRAAHPQCHTILDVASGTGEHARLLAEKFGYDVDGSDLNPDFVRIASTKHRAGRFIVADMAALRLERQYDAVLCLAARSAISAISRRSNKRSSASARISVPTAL